MSPFVKGIAIGLVLGFVIRHFMKGRTAVTS